VWPTKGCRNPLQSCVAGAQQSCTSLCWEKGREKSEALEIAKKVNDNPGAGSTLHTGDGETCWEGCTQCFPIPVQGAAPQLRALRGAGGLCRHSTPGQEVLGGSCGTETQCRWIAWLSGYLEITQWERSKGPLCRWKGPLGWKEWVAQELGFPMHC